KRRVRATAAATFCQFKQ
ncbi:hypothetical protein VCHC64A1_02657B, partial [Vibrio cholerae HC-64A1]